METRKWTWRSALKIGLIEELFEGKNRLISSAPLNPVKIFLERQIQLIYILEQQYDAETFANNVSAATGKKTN